MSQDSYGHNIIPSILTNRLALYMHYFTIYGSLRPFGASALLAAYDEDIKAAELYMIEPSGAACRYLGTYIIPIPHPHIHVFYYYHYSTINTTTAISTTLIRMFC